MKVPLFVTCSAAFLAAWLGVTFFREVPSEAYPQLGKKSVPLSAKVEEESVPLIMVEETEESPELAAE